MHDFDPRGIEAMASERTQGLGAALQSIRSSSEVVSSLWFLCRDGQSIASFGAAARAEHAVILRGLRILAEATVALFDLAANPGKPVAATIDGQTFTLTVAAPHGYCDPSEWLDGYYAAAAARHASAASSLANVDAKLFDYSRPSAERDAYQYAMVLGVRALARRDADAKSRLTEALALVRPARVSVSPEDVRLRHQRELETALAIAENDTARFNESLEAALLAHRAYWGASEERRESPEGFVALAPLGLAALAHDRGLAVGVASDYTPNWIVAGGP